MFSFSKPRQRCRHLKRITIPGGRGCGVAMGDEKRNSLWWQSVSELDKDSRYLLYNDYDPKWIPKFYSFISSKNPSASILPRLFRCYHWNADYPFLPGRCLWNRKRWFATNSQISVTAPNNIISFSPMTYIFSLG